MVHVAASPIQVNKSDVAARLRSLNMTLLQLQSQKEKELDESQSLREQLYSLAPQELVKFFEFTDAFEKLVTSSSQDGEISLTLPPLPAFTSKEERRRILANLRAAWEGVVIVTHQEEHDILWLKFAPSTT